MAETPGPVSRSVSLTPIRKQYLDIKRRYPHAIVFFRLGDFYETFDDDAEICARELEITLTSKPMGKNLRVPLAGIPYHAVETYLARLIQKGYKVAICEQMGDPAKAKGLVERKVVRVVTPGTVLEGNLLDQRSNNYLAALVTQGGRSGIAYADVSTGEFAATELPAAEAPAELARLAPAELLLPEGSEAPEPYRGPVTAVRPEWADPEEAQEELLRHFEAGSLEGIGIAGRPLAVAAAGVVLRYLAETQASVLGHVTRLASYTPSAFMTLDAHARRNLEIFATLRQGTAAGSLLGVLDGTKTAMGARLLRRWLGQPLLDVAAIRARHDAVAFCHESAVRRARLQGVLSKVPDLERLLSRVSSGVATPRDLVALRRGLEQVPALRAVLEEAEPGAVRDRLLAGLRPLPEVAELIAAAVEDEPAATFDQGGVIRAGFHAELDALRRVSRDARQYLSELERQERERTGIRSLKLGYNKVFGYYIEVSNANLSLVPADYQRRQTLVGAERFITPELKEYETQILNARERMGEIEEEIFRQVCGQVSAAGAQVLACAAAVAELDVYVALADAAARHGYVRPEVDGGDVLEIEDGRHPVVERMLPEGSFVPNDTRLSGREQIAVITGPNMAGKSTYLRQVALMVLMAQAGSFVPARAARIGVVDRIFTRVGAQDDLASGQSTFMVEMLETAHILHNATPRSLVILDEIGRGTSTYDGLAIAQAVVEYLHHREQGPKTLFATHYHELVALAEVLPRVRNYNVAVTEEGGRVVFLHKIVPGGADRSYGIHVAQLAGLPRPVVARAQELLAELERRGRGRGRRGEPAAQLSLFSAPPDLVRELASLEVDGMTPLEALTRLYELRERAKRELGE
ncbi:MAG TPA: DNA mismatch repair protein MutS [Dehalococcoidia bacterium]